MLLNTVKYNDSSLFDMIPKYTITNNKDGVYRIEWEEFFIDEDDALERWMNISYKENILLIEYAYETFKYPIQNFEYFFKLYLTNIEEFVKPLNKSLSPDIRESMLEWEKTALTYYINEEIEKSEYLNILNFLKEECYIDAPPIVIENIILKSPLLNSLFKKPNDIFPIMYAYPPCTKFFLKFIVPILYDVIFENKLFKKEGNYINV